MNLNGLKKEHIFDDAVNSLKFIVNTGSSDESTSEDAYSSSSAREFLSDCESD